MRPRALSLIVAATMSALGCSDPAPPAAPDAGTGDDAGSADAGAGDASPRVEPTAPAPPVLTPCPDRWETVLGEPATCEPFRGGGTLDCGPGEARFPGDAACARVGPACAADGWPAELPAGGVLYVQASAMAGGDGSRAMPFATVGEALAVAASGGVIAIAPGTYDELLSIAGDVELRGACASEVLLTSPATFGVGGTVTVEDGARALLRDVSVTSEQRPGIVVNGAVELENVVIANAAETGLRASRGSVTGRGVVVRDTRSGTGGLVAGIEVAAGGSISLDRVVVENNQSTGIFVEGSTLALRDFVLRGFAASSVEDTGWAVLGLPESTITLERGFTGESENGAFVMVGAGTTMILSDVVIRDVVATATSSATIHAEDGARVEATRVLIENVSSTGLGARDGAAVLVVTDTVVRDSESSPAQLGRGLELVGPASIVLGRTAFVRALELGLFVTGAGAELSVTDLRVDETGPGASGLFGRGIQAQLGSSVTIERASLSRNREVSVASTEPGTMLHGTDVRIAGTLERACAETTCAGAGAGTGAAALTGGYLALERFVVTDNPLCGVQLARGGTADLSDGEISFNAVGANVQTEGFDPSRLSVRVGYRDNGVNLDSSELFVPSPAVP